MMKRATYSSLYPAKAWVMLLLAIFTLQSCGPQLDVTPTEGSSGFDEQLTQETLADVTAEICIGAGLGGDSDGDGACDQEEAPECVDDPYCFDDADKIPDGNKEYNTGAWGRFLGGLGIAAAGAGVVVGIVGASGLVQRKGKDKWGWLNNLIQDNQQADTNGFVRLLDKNGISLNDDLLDIEMGDDEVFYTRPNGEKWMMRMTQLELTNEDFGVFINGKMFQAGKEILLCIGGRTAWEDAGTQFVSNEDGDSEGYPASNLSIYMKEDYLGVHKEFTTRNGFLNDYCNGPNGGIFTALQTADGEYFVNPLLTSTFADYGNVSEATFGEYDYAITLKYLFEQLPESITPNEEGPIVYRKYNTNVTNGAGPYDLTPTDIEDYNDCTTNACRMALAMGYGSTNVPTQASVDKGKMNLETQMFNAGLQNPQSLSDPADRAFHESLGNYVSDLNSQTGTVIYVGPGGTVNYYEGGSQ